IPIEHGRYLADQIEGARFVELPGRNHVPWADTGLLAEEIEQFVTGKRPAPDHDRVLATVLFTDIVGSTERASSLGDRRWRDLLQAHDSIVRNELGRYRGREINRTGDGFVATFDGPARAIACSRSITQAVRGLGIDVRAGLHTGEIELLDDGVGGIAVHIAARVAALAGAREVLVSSTVKDLVVGSGIGFVEHGSHELKGVPGEWRLYAVAT
ncbi:MAG: adenylate/guanylate cyclase domain-containing protein, partial [Chloroflexi bacterium]|nr:adenylate/guanylate cyclase domain-containing protein [Chloroflexota bacterium]